jgi:hypothetical protein
MTLRFSKLGLEPQRKGERKGKIDYEKPGIAEY